jgi:hypothetical protein
VCGQNPGGSHVLHRKDRQETGITRQAIVTHRHKIIPVAFLLLSACGTDAVGPVETLSAAQLDALGLAADIVIDRSEVARGGEFAVTYTIINTGTAPVRLESACVAVARGVVLRGGNVANFIGSSSGCRTAIGTHDIAADATLQMTWQVRAAIIVQAHPDGREPDIEPAPAGEYVFRVEPDVLTVNGVEARLPVIEQKFTVR